MSTDMASRTSQSGLEHGNQSQESGQEMDAQDFTRLLSEVSESFESYCRSRPGVVAGVLFGLGFFCGWKLRPW